MGSLENRIKNLESSIGENQQQETIIISREVYNEMDMVQQLNLPKYVLVELSEDEANREDKILNGELSCSGAFREESEEDKAAFDKEFDECLKKYGGFIYHWDEKELRELAVPE